MYTSWSFSVSRFKIYFFVIFPYPTKIYVHALWFFKIHFLISKIQHRPIPYLEVSIKKERNKEKEDQPLQVGWIEPRQWDDDLAKASTSVFPKLPITPGAIPNEPLVMTEGSPENTLHWSLWILCSKKMCKLFPIYPTFPFITGLLLFYADFNRFWFYCNCVFILFF